MNGKVQGERLLRVCVWGGGGGGETRWYVQQQVNTRGRYCHLVKQDLRHRPYNGLSLSLSFSLSLSLFLSLSVSGLRYCVKIPRIPSLCKEIKKCVPYSSVGREKVYG